MKKKTKKLSDSQLAARLRFIEKYGAAKVKKTFFEKYIDHGIVYIALNFAMWGGIAFLITKCSD